MKYWLLVSWLFFCGAAMAGDLERPGRVKHVVLIQLKNPEDLGRFMGLSKRLVKLPGVVRYSIGPTVPKEDERKEGFDVGVVVTLENRQALYDYLRHPRHQEIIEAMRPLVARIEVFDFVTH
ncbi:MAG TPA: Dabb family protein [Methylothermaceae bacterium]|nr:Dabb family protein [Methylothermaceae bacterium]